MTESRPTEETNALLAAVVASSMDAVFSIDTNARIQTWNSAAEQLYGYTAAEAIGQRLGLLAPDPTNYAPGIGRCEGRRPDDIRRRMKPSRLRVRSSFGQTIDVPVYWLAMSHVARETRPKAARPLGRATVQIRARSQER
jgi:PAS domain S-box-containing protein